MLNFRKTFPVAAFFTSLKAEASFEKFFELNGTIASPVCHYKTFKRAKLTDMFDSCLDNHTVIKKLLSKSGQSYRNT